MSGYKFDIFISYSRYGSVQKWLLNHFLRKLKECLADQIAPAPKVYVDREMPRGVHWSSSLKHALRYSKIMLQLLTPHYFESPWCMAEWRSMQEREKMLGLASLSLPQGLIYPILYSDSENFPLDGRMISWVDFKEFAHPDPPFQTTGMFVDFHREVTKLATDLVQLLKQVPEWQPDWPIVEEPKPVLIPPPPIPRFGE
ncbi:TIR domain-containing protein [Goodfellowiella coeruleoviolacea]|uniref:TIR domain-containing protein n=1 Tax=Goodfellowiella coeruleoviolacea TaxID=334858 RepID=A0AAE3GH41_9PSEU|nr:TIR domain-containing protein [Goodfellowiella coeruleoviolacea]MCP2167244.1 TIR domain-containing protein [Goodfellowiella coeruleoviolacea]